MQRSDSGFVRNSLVFHGVLPHPGLAVGVGAGAPQMGESHFLFFMANVFLGAHLHLAELLSAGAQMVGLDGTPHRPPITLVVSRRRALE